MSKSAINIFDAIKISKTFSPQLKIALMLLEEYNVRASEALSALRINYHPNRMLIIKGNKHSGDIIVRDRQLLSMIGELPVTSNELLLPDLSYGILYRVVKQNYSHLFSKFKSRKNHKVTHGFRFLNANLSDDPSSVKSILNHNSKSSGRYYNPRLPVIKRH